MNAYHLTERRTIRAVILFTLITILTACSVESMPATAPTTNPKTTSTVPVEPTPTETPSAAYQPAFEEAPCPFDVPEGQRVECGFVVVPEDHSDPTGPTIRIAVAVFRDEGNGHQPDPVMVLSGGPGQKTVAHAPPLVRTLALFATHRDIILFDQRGVGLSEPALECPESTQAYLDLLDEPDTQVKVQRSFDALIACRERLASKGIDLSAYNNVQNAADVNAIRVALGYHRVNLFGGSYGSLLAQVVMRHHPEGIRSAILHSALPLEASLLVDLSTTAWDAVARLLDACAADEACNSAYPDLGEVLFAVIDQLNAKPVPITVTDPRDGGSYDSLLSGDEVLANLVVFLYQTSVIPLLPKAVYDVHNGDYQLMTALSSAKLNRPGVFSIGMYYSVLCTDDLLGRTPQDLLQIRAGLPEQLTATVDPEAAIAYGPFGICER